MKRNVIHALCLTVLFLFVCCMLGCGGIYKEQRFYSGPPLPKNEIALVTTVSGCVIYGLRDEREKKVKGVPHSLYSDVNYMIDLLPGHYMASISYERKGYGTLSTGGMVQLELNIQAGNIYVIYPAIKGPFGPKASSYLYEKYGYKWYPILANINDYNKEECDKYNGRCPDKEEIKEWATKYLQGERPYIQSSTNIF